MNIDINSLTVENITREIMDSMNDEQIKEFKERLTPEEKNKLQKRFGGSTMASLDEEMNVKNSVSSTKTNTNTNDSSPQQIPFISLSGLKNISANSSSSVSTPSNGSNNDSNVNQGNTNTEDNSMKQTGPIQFGVKKTNEIVDELE